jgi:hypothetical protein
LFGARLDNDVQLAATEAILSASVAFVALSGEAEYAYAWLFCVDRNAWIRAPESRRLCGQRGRSGCGINTVPEVGVGKLVNLSTRTTAVELPV